MRFIVILAIYKYILTKHFNGNVCIPACLCKFAISQSCGSTANYNIMLSEWGNCDHAMFSYLIPSVATDSSFCLWESVMLL